MKRNGQTIVCREGFYYLLVVALVFGGALVREVNLLLMLGGILVGPVVFSWRVVRLTLQGLKVQRKVPHGICAGDLLVASVTLENTRRRVGSWAVVVEEQLLRETPSGREKPRREKRQRDKPIRPSVLFPYVPAAQSRRGVYRGRLPRRGRYRLGPLRLSTRFPFGLLRRTITAGGTETLTVFPRLGRLTRRWAARHHEAFAGTHRREQRHGLEGDFYGVRQWRGGDSRRWIHWRNFARTGKLVVRQFEQPRNRDVAVLLDLWQPDNPRPKHLENVELAVSFAATVVADLCRAGGGNLLLSTGGPHPRHTAGPASAALLQDMMEQLAVAEGAAEDRLDELIDYALGKIDPGNEIVLVGSRPVNLADRSRFPSLSSDPSRRKLAQQIRCIDASSDQLARYFQPE